MVFDQFKKIAELKRMQDAFKKEKTTLEKRGILVTINGNFEVINIKLSPELSIDDQQNVLKDCLNEAREKIQKILAQKMMGAGLGNSLGF